MGISDRWDRVSRRKASRILEMTSSLAQTAAGNDSDNNLRRLVSQERKTTTWSTGTVHSAIDVAFFTASMSNMFSNVKPSDEPDGTIVIEIDCSTIRDSVEYNTIDEAYTAHNSCHS